MPFWKRQEPQPPEPVKIRVVRDWPKPKPLKHVLTESGSFEDFKNTLNKQPLIIIILGARGQGKTALSYTIAENLALNKRVDSIGINEKLPNYIRKVKRIEQTRTHSTVLIDEAGINYSARMSMSKANKKLSQDLFVARHNDQSIILVAQNSSTIDINIIRLADILLIKRPSLLQSDFERAPIKKLLRQAETSINKITPSLEESKKYTYCLSNQWRGILKSGLPSFWNDKISTSYRKKE